MTSEMTTTYQTRFESSAEMDELLQRCATLLSSVERSLFAKVSSGSTSLSCKNEFLKKYGITARQFNACRVSLDGKISAARASQELTVANLKRQIKIVDGQIDKLSRKPSKEKIIHLKKRRKQALCDRLDAKERDLKEKKVRLCFGGRKLFRSQFHPEKNGYSSLKEWKTEWKEKRDGEFFILGSKDETAGNQTCTARIQSDGKLSLRLRLPPSLEKESGKYIEIRNVVFAYGHEKILSALSHPGGKALSYRFKRDKKGWRVFTSVSLEKVEAVTQEGIGVIGIDLNADHIACVETDRFGNPISKVVFPWVSYGKTREQLKALTCDVCKEIVEMAKSVKKPIVIEKLDFQEKKTSLKQEKNHFARLLSGFAYNLFFNLLSARAFKQGIVVHRVNPAYTSVIGRINYAKRYGLTTHLAAALCIARRYLRLSETPISSQGIIPDGKGGHVAFVLPERNRTKHVWHFWRQVSKKLPTVLAAHHRAMRNRS